MKICLINNLYGPWSRGGAEKVVELLAPVVQEAGHELIIISTKPYLAKAPKTVGVKIYYLPSLYYYLDKLPKPARLLWHLWQVLGPNRFNRLKKILEEEKVEAVLTHNLLGLGFGLGFLAQSQKLKHIHWLHDVQLLQPSGLVIFKREAALKFWPAKIYQHFSKLAIGQPQVVISPSAWLLNEHEQHGFFQNSQTIILHNPLKQRAGYQTKIKRHDFVFLFVGQVAKHKGVELLVKAFAKFLSNNDVKAKLEIAGDGPLFKKLDSQPLPRVSLLGRLNKEDLNEFMSQADCLVVPSLCYENSPTVIYEAAANNLPVIASDLGGTKELINEKYLFKPTVDELADKLKWAYQKDSDLHAPLLSTPSPKEYWEKIERLIQ